MPHRNYSINVCKRARVERQFVWTKIGSSQIGIDDTITGSVVDVDGHRVTLETPDGFTMTYSSKELVKISGTLKVSNYDIAQIKAEKEGSKRKRSQVVKPKERSIPKMEVDLHIHQLTNSTKAMSNYEMLNLQLETAKRQLEFAIGKRIQKVAILMRVTSGG